jgi:hypothetical protein
MNESARDLRDREERSGKMARMSSEDRRLILQAEEAALDHGSVDRVFGKRAAGARKLAEAVAEKIVSQEEEAALDQGAVERVVGQRSKPLPPGDG